MKLDEFDRCLFKERPAKGCEFQNGPSDCFGEDWDRVMCFLKHYGLDLKEHANMRLMDAFVHLVLGNDDFDDPERYGLPPKEAKHGNKVKVRDL